MKADASLLLVLIYARANDITAGAYSENKHYRVKTLSRIGLKVHMHSYTGRDRLCIDNMLECLIPTCGRITRD